MKCGARRACSSSLKDSTGCVTVITVATESPKLLPIPDGIGDSVIRLREWRDDDVELLREGAEDDYVAMIEHLPVPFSERDARVWLDDQPTWPARGRGWSLAIADANTGTGIGSVGLVLRHPPGIAELGYWVTPRRRGEGVATRAVTLLGRWALTAETGVHRLHALIEPWNVASATGRHEDRVRSRRSPPGVLQLPRRTSR